MVSPNHLETLAARPAFTRYDSASGTGWIQLKGEKKRRAFQVDGEPRIARTGNDGDVLSACFSRSVKGKVRQQISYCALPIGAVAVFSRWQALGNVEVAELVDHPFRWVEIDKFVSKPTVEREPPGHWVVSDTLRMVVLGGPAGEVAADGINGTVRREFAAASGEDMQASVCVFQPLFPGQLPAPVTGDAEGVKIGAWSIRRDAEGELAIEDGTSK